MVSGWLWCTPTATKDIRNSAWCTRAGPETCQGSGSPHVRVAPCTSGGLWATTAALPGTYTTVASTELGGHKPQLRFQQPGWLLVAWGPHRVASIQGGTMARHRACPRILGPSLMSGGLMGLWSHPKRPDLGGPAVSRGLDDKTTLERWPGTGCLIAAAGWVVWGYYSSILYRDRFIRMDG